MRPRKRVYLELSTCPSSGAIEVVEGLPRGRPRHRAVGVNGWLSLECNSVCAFFTGKIFDHGSGWHALGTESLLNSCQAPRSIEEQ